MRRQLQQAGAAAAYVLLLVGACFITDAMGPHPVLDISTGADTPVVLRLFAQADVMSTICMPNRRPIFTFHHPTDGSHPVYQSHLGSATSS